MEVQEIISQHPGLSSDQLLDIIEHKMVTEHTQIECEVVHRFTDKLYSREVIIPKGSFVTSKIHKTEHPFVVLSGDIEVWTEGEKRVRVGAGYVGITKAGTRRLAFTHEETKWITFHVNEDNETDVDVIETRVIEPHDNLLLSKKKEELQ